MNYLAHAWLSFNKETVLAGNMTSDFIKGKKQYDYPLPIQHGIRLHRFIDEFTDNHAAIKEMKAFFRPAYGLYAGALVDIVCDHFLATDKNEFSSVNELLHFSTNTYQLLEKQMDLLPGHFQQMFVYMKQYDWLSNYRYDWAIKKSFTGLVRRSTYMKEADTAYAIFLEHKEAMRPHYDLFFPLLKKYSLNKLQQLENTD
jgi:acyl carrier protein phosphodiesterase